jgi:hypothetical protein
MRWLIASFLALLAPSVAAQWPPPAPYVAIGIPQDPEEPFHGAVPSPIGRMLYESEMIEGEAVVVGAEGDSTEQGCGPILTGVGGRIAVIRRGGCSSGQKAVRASEAGAVAALIYNDVTPGSAADTSIAWQDGPGDSALVVIPVAFTRALTGAVLRASARAVVEYAGSGGCFDYNGTADPTAPSDYFPLAVGNAWEYVAWLYPDSYRQRLDITADTLVEGQLYLLLRDARYPTTNPTTPTSVETRLVRFDSVSASVDGSCPLDTPFESGIGPCFAGGSPGLKSFGSCYSGMADGGSWVHSYQAGRGLVRSVYYAVSQPVIQPIDIVYSRVGGVEIGTPYVWPVAVGSPAEMVEGALRVSPSPATSEVIVSFALPFSGSPTIEIVDMLGRRVASRGLGRRPAGAGEEVLDVSRLAPGRYMVRLVGDHEVRLSAPLVIAR